MSKLNPQQELFCKLYASDREFFGNGTQAYIEAYNVNTSDPRAYNSARSAAGRLLTNVAILARINEYLEDLVLNDSHVDKQLGFWITQKESPQASVAAIKEYNALKHRITKKLEIDLGLKDTREKIKEFLDDTTDTAYDAERVQPTAADESDGSDEVAPSTSDIS